MPPFGQVRERLAAEFSHSPPQPFNDRFGWLRQKLMKSGA